MPVTTPEIDPSEIAVFPRPKYRVSVKFDWAETWDVVDYLEPLSATDAAGPDKPTATLRWRAGSIKYEDETAPRNREALNLLDWFVKIEVDDMGWKTLFVGRVVGDQAEFKGLSQGSTVDQIITCYGLSHELDRVVLSTSYIVNRDDPDVSTRNKAVEINRCLVFNDDYVPGFREIGNRSEDKVKLADDDALSGYAFSDDQDDDGESFAWSVRDILNHLLTFHYRTPDEGLTFVLGGQVEALDDLIYPEVRVEGQTIFRVLNELVDRRRGLGWCVRVGNVAIGDAGGGVDGEPPTTSTVEVATIHIFTVVDEDVEFGEGVLPANGQQVTLMSDGEGHLVAGEEITRDTLARFGKVVVEGEPIVVCFSVSFGAGNLEFGWTNDEATAYKAAASSADAAVNDEYRSTLRFEHVYQKFVIPRKWKWETRDVETDPDDDDPDAAEPPVRLNLKVDTDTGTIDPTDAVASQAHTRTWGHRLLRSLPIRKVETKDDGEPDYERPFVMLRKDVSGSPGYRWVMAHDPEGGSDVGANVSMLDRDFGIQVSFSPNHLLAKEFWTGSPASTKHQPKYSPAFVAATVAARTDESIRVEVDLEGDPNRTLRIKVPDAELWWIAKGTVTAIGSSGTTLTRESHGRILRDDSERLRKIAALAVAWYGVERVSLRLVTRELATEAPVGAYVTSIGGIGEMRPVNSVVNRVEWDFTNITTARQTQFGDLDVTAGGRPARHTLR